jgi:hypothetical protein
MSKKVCALQTVPYGLGLGATQDTGFLAFQNMGHGCSIVTRGKGVVDK